MFAVIVKHEYKFIKKIDPVEINVFDTLEEMKNYLRIRSRSLLGDGRGRSFLSEHEGWIDHPDHGYYHFTFGKVANK